MNNIKDILKGFVIGIANIIPGLSGGTMAVVFNIYDKFVTIFSELVNHPFKMLKKNWSLIVGILLGLVGGLFIIVKLLEVAPIPTMMLFVGLIIGAIPKIYDETNKTKKSIPDYIVFLLMAIILVILPLLPKGEAKADIDFVTILIVFGAGILAAAAMVVPGISGSMVLLALGYYEYVTSNVSSLIKSVFNGFDGFTDYFVITLAVAIGILIGLVAISKLINLLFRKYERTVYCGILGFLVASPFSVIYSMINEYGDTMKENIVFSIILGVVTLIIGTWIAYTMSKIKVTNDNNEKM